MTSTNEPKRYRATDLRSGKTGMVSKSVAEILENFNIIANQPVVKVEELE